MLRDMRNKLIVLSFFVFSVLVITARGEEEKKEEYLDSTFWGALIYAKNEGSKSGVGGELEIKLKKAFKAFKSFEFLGQHTQRNVFKEYVNWVVPSEEINLGFESKGRIKNGGVKLLLKLWRKKKVLLKSDLSIFPDKPVMIMGPKWRDGKLIFVLELTSKN